jgi:hypothetical protein
MMRRLRRKEESKMNYESLEIVQLGDAEELIASGPDNMVDESGALKTFPSIAVYAEDAE